MRQITLVQCAEYLSRSEDILKETYSNCCWQNRTFDAASGLACGNAGKLTDLGFRLGLMDFPEEVSANQDRIAKTALQYLENHDHSRFVCNFKTICGDDELLKEGDRSLWYKVQPYLIGLLTARGIPLLWQGQEFGENYYLPGGGMGRILMFRPVRWDYFYDEIGQSIIHLVRRLWTCAASGNSTAAAIISTTTMTAISPRTCCSFPALRRSVEPRRPQLWRPGAVCPPGFSRRRSFPGRIARRRGLVLKPGKRRQRPGPLAHHPQQLRPHLDPRGGLISAPPPGDEGAQACCAPFYFDLAGQTFQPAPGNGDPG